MRFPRTLAFAALAASPVLSLTSCGGDAEGARTTLGTVQTTSYVVEDPVTTTTTTTLPTAVPEGEVSPTEQIHIVVAGDSLSKISSMYGITLDALINYNAWTDGINHVILPGAEVKIPPNSQVPSATARHGARRGTAAVATPVAATTRRARRRRPPGWAARTRSRRATIPRVSPTSTTSPSTSWRRPMPATPPTRTS